MYQIEILGYIAGFLVATALAPQIIKTWKTKSAKDISYKNLEDKICKRYLNIMGCCTHVWLVFMGNLCNNSKNNAINCFWNN